MNEPMKLTCDRNTRIIVEIHADGYLTAELQRIWDEEWVTFGHASGANGEVLIVPHPNPEPRRPLR